MTIADLKKKYWENQCFYKYSLWKALFYFLIVSLCLTYDILGTLATIYLTTTETSIQHNKKKNCQAEKVVWPSCWKKNAQFGGRNATITLKLRAKKDYFVSENVRNKNSRIFIFFLANYTDAKLILFKKMSIYDMQYVSLWCKIFSTSQYTTRSPGYLHFTHS